MNCYTTVINTVSSFLFFLLSFLSFLEIVFKFFRFLIVVLGGKGELGRSVAGLIGSFFL